VTLTRNTPRFPAPFLLVTEITLEPLPSILTSDNPIVKLFPFPAWEALMMRTPVPFVTVNVDVPVLWASSLWLNEILLGLSVETHCGIGVAEGDALGVAVGVGDAFGLPLFPFPLLPSLFPFPCGVAVGDGEAAGDGVGVGLAPSDGEGLTDGLGDTEAAGVGVAWSTSSVTAAIEMSGIF